MRHAEIVSARPTLEEVGVEGLTFEFGGAPKRAHNQEEGFNAVFFHDVSNSWIRDVAMVDADIGVFLSGCSHSQI